MCAVFVGFFKVFLLLNCQFGGGGSVDGVSLCSSISWQN